MNNSTNKEKLKQLINNRRNIYQLLSRLFQKEIDDDLYEALKGIRFPVDYNGNILAEYRSALTRYNDYFNYDAGESVDDLAVDYAKTFLGAGIAQGATAFPFESVYTSAKKIMMQEAWSEVTAIYEKNGLERDDICKDLMEDHIAIELNFMAYLCEETNEHTELSIGLEKQKEFLNRHLLNWVPGFCLDIKQYADTEFYRMVGQLTSSFLQLDSYILDQMIIQRKSRNIEPKSFVLSHENMNRVIEHLKEEYHVYAPMFMKDKTSLEEKKVVRYQEINSISDIVLDRQSTFSPKETIYPVLQTLFTFDENKSVETITDDTKDIIIFARACDINGIKRLDNIFLANGHVVDTYYKRLRDKLKIFVMECGQGFEHCYCVSMGTNETDNYSAGFNLFGEEIKVVIKDSEFLTYFQENDSCDYEVQFIQENIKKVNIPQIDGMDTLNKVHGLDMWEEMSEDCISCGGCNTVCPTCSCYDAVDYLNQENSRRGKRCRVWSSCMLPDYSKTAGGHIARPKPAQMMRFKTLHKVYDYNKRFGGNEHMCVGCGRCTMNCPKEISFSDIVNKLAENLDR